MKPPEAKASGALFCLGRIRELVFLLFFRNTKTRDILSSAAAFRGLKLTRRRLIFRGWPKGSGFSVNSHKKNELGGLSVLFPITFRFSAGPPHALIRVKRKPRSHFAFPVSQKTRIDSAEKSKTATSPIAVLRSPGGTAFFRGSSIWKAALLPLGIRVGDEV